MMPGKYKDVAVAKLPPVPAASAGNGGSLLNTLLTIRRVWKDFVTFQVIVELMSHHGFTLRMFWDVAVFWLSKFMRLMNWACQYQDTGPSVQVMLPVAFTFGAASSRLRVPTSLIGAAEPTCSTRVLVSR